MERKKFGYLELRTQKLGEGFTRIELDFKGRYIWTTCRSGEESKAVVELLRELFEDEIESLQRICEEMKIDIGSIFKFEAIKG
ncbi:hypothetical protein JGI1_01377 [Candidatus Thermokryptus mobilis]|uniref:PqqD family protein n=1 Tax=Candidatus Thermokryptus mobilis TaxID=1643428 RepID=A0A0S4N409_9BACT|nr:hypothetical protein [Candidatus Thermokryptus mobilis]CUU06020.1 hypothetical protein JGI1_01377 [Candidatus Thermokryptus mobilis]